MLSSVSCLFPGCWRSFFNRFYIPKAKMLETPTDQIVDDAKPLLHEFGRTFDVVDILSGITSTVVKCILLLK